MNFYNKTVNILFSGFVIIILLLDVFCQNCDYFYRNSCGINNIYLLLIGFVFLGIFLFVNNIISTKINIKLCVVVLTCFLFISQMFVAYHIYFLTDWDVVAILKTALPLTQGKIDVYYNYSIYPQQLIMTLIFSDILFINNKLGAFSGDFVYFSIVTVNVILKVFACYLIYAVLRKFMSEKIAFLDFYWDFLHVEFLHGLQYAILIL